MKFDYVIGNPPYNEEVSGQNADFQAALFPQFMDESFRIAQCVELIHPSRVFTANSGPLKRWSQKMLTDPHLKVLSAEPDARKVFPDVEIKGGVCVSYRDETRDFGPMGFYSQYPEMYALKTKIAPEDVAQSLMSLIGIQMNLDLQRLYEEYPEARTVIGSSGKDRRLEKNIFTKLSIFTDSPVDDTDVRILGVQENTRFWKYVHERYVDHSHPALDKYKTVIACTNGNGALSEVLSAPLVMNPREGYTRSFISIGPFDTSDEAENALKYVKSKTARTALHFLKTTQMNNRDTWRYVPLQDFTSLSDIDWSQSIADIDQQLYKKYGLSDDEIEFIESHVKEMV